jgi:hypothetical protein
MRILSVSEMRLLVFLLVSTTALVAVAVATSSPSAVVSRACTPKEILVNIQLLGDRSWGFGLERYTAIPSKRATIVVWSDGGPPATQGVTAYGWATRTQSAFSNGCAAGRAFRSQTGSLRAPVRVKDGWFFGRKYKCIEPGRFVVEIRDIAGGKRVTVRVQRTGKLLAVGEVTTRGGWLRGAKSCGEYER